MKNGDNFNQVRERSFNIRGGGGMGRGGMMGGRGMMPPPAPMGGGAIPPPVPPAPPVPPPPMGGGGGYHHRPHRRGGWGSWGFPYPYPWFGYPYGEIMADVQPADETAKKDEQKKEVSQRASDEGIMVRLIEGGMLLGITAIGSGIGYTIAKASKKDVAVGAIIGGIAFLGGSILYFKSKPSLPTVTK